MRSKPFDPKEAKLKHQFVVKAMKDINDAVKAGNFIKVESTRTIPPGEQWAHEPRLVGKLTRADEWMQKHLPTESSIADLEAKSRGEFSGLASSDGGKK